MAMKQNTADLQALLEQANALPEFVDTTDATAIAGDMLSGKTAYADGKKITGTIATKTASNLTANGATVTVPAGYYATQATKSVATATQATPSISIDANGKITATATQNAGYVSAGTKTGTKQMTVQAAKTVTPTKSSQTAVAKNVYTTGAVTVAPIPDQYEDRTESLPKLNAANGGTAATTIAAAVDNTQTHASEQETLISDIDTALENLGASGGSGAAVETCTVTITDSIHYMSYIGVNGIETAYTVGTYTCLNPSIAYARFGGGATFTGDCGEIFSLHGIDQSEYCFSIEGNATINGPDASSAAPA